MKAGFIGLGHLGRAMAGRLASHGVDLILWNRSPEKAADLGRELGLPVAESPAALAEESEVIFLNLFDSAAVRAVLQGESGLLAGGLREKLVIDTTTNHFKDVLDFHKWLSSSGGSYLEATVLGSVVPASQGKLTVLASGEKEAYQRGLPYLEKLAASIFYLEVPGLATRMKLVNNLILGSFMAAISEAVALGEATGVEKTTVLDILAAGAGASGVLNAKKDKLLREDFSPQFQSALIYKDLHYLQDLAFQLKRPVFLASAVKEMYGLTYARGEEKLDFSALYRILKESS
jgi:3-hydroxyisobutyrate dehydrogenase